MFQHPQKEKKKQETNFLSLFPLIKSTILQLFIELCIMM